MAGFPISSPSLEDRVAGYAYAGPYRPRPAYRFTVENSVYLQPAIHRRGIGLQLMQRLITECEARGYRQMIAVIGDSANAGSIGVHTRTGFQMIGTHPNVGLKFGRWLDTVMMQRALGEGATTVPPESRPKRLASDFRAELRRARGGNRVPTTKSRNDPMRRSAARALRALREGGEPPGLDLKSRKQPHAK